MTNNTISDAVTMPGSKGALLANRYRVVRQLGQGGMGSVWLAEDTLLDNKPFAIKMLPSILVSNKRAYRQLKDEALVAMKLSHPNIVTLRAFEENSGNPFLVMDYIDGQTLDDYLAEKGKLSENETIRLLRPIAAALDYAHGEGVVHRDVKPANVMIRRDGHPYILDFGIARELQETMTRVTGKLSSGTLLYMSPEQLNGAQPRLEQDVYSFAVVVYECLKGEPPFCRGQVDRQILENNPEPLPDGVADLRFVASIMSGLSKDPVNRPRSCVGLLFGRSAVTRAEGPSRVGAGSGTGDARRRTPIKISASSRPLAAGASVGQRKISAIALAAALVMAVAGVAGYSAWSAYDRHVKSVRATEEEVKRKNAEEERKRVVALRQKAEMEAAYAKASGRRAVVAGINKADGFEKLIREFDGLFGEADAFRTAQRFSDAAMAYTNVIAKAETIVKMDMQRNEAVSSRNEALSAKRGAETAKAGDNCRADYDSACAAFASANDLFLERDFVVAKRSFDKLKVSFEECGKKSARISEEKRQAMVQARVSAMEQWNKVMTISDANGFQKRKQALQSAIDGAQQFADGDKIDEAKQKYLSIKNVAGALLGLDVERNNALTSRKAAVAAFGDAKKTGAMIFPSTSRELDRVTNGEWETAERLMESMDFKRAKEKFDDACRLYRKCEGNARDCNNKEEERKRVEVDQKQKAGLEHRTAEELKFVDTSSLKPGAPITIMLKNGCLIDLNWCPPGEYEMASPRKKKSVGGFWIGRYEVSQELWKSVMGGFPRRCLTSSDVAHFPVSGVSRVECYEFVKRLNESNSTNGFRLPTDDEWEYAARVGGSGTSPLPPMGAMTLLPGGSCGTNGWGVCDMCGNVAEWCDGDFPYEELNRFKKMGFMKGVGGILRGGSFSDGTRCAVTNRRRAAPEKDHETFGLRLSFSKK